MCMSILVYTRVLSGAEEVRNSTGMIFLRMSIYLTVYTNRESAQDRGLVLTSVKDVQSIWSWTSYTVDPIFSHLEP